MSGFLIFINLTCQNRQGIQRHESGQFIMVIAGEPYFAPTNSDDGLDF